MLKKKTNKKREIKNVEIIILLLLVSFSLMVFYYNHNYNQSITGFTISERNLNCDVKTRCATTETCIFSMLKQSDSHVATCGSNYPYKLCCRSSETLISTITNEECTSDFVLSIFRAIDSHIDTRSSSNGGYLNNVCLSSQNTAIRCHIEDKGTSSNFYGICDSGECLTTIYKTSDSHVADCKGNNKASIAICCQLAGILPGDDDNDRIPNEVDRCPNTPQNKDVNRFGCVLPKFSRFGNNLTTNFEVEDITSLTNFSVGILNKSRIRFKEINVNLENIDLDSNIILESEFIEINTSEIPQLKNLKAIITFYNITKNNPIIYRNDTVCSDCEIINYTNNILNFNVSHFTTYSVIEGTYCGDSVCNTNEDCNSCSSDCGSCPSDGGSGGSGGGGGGGGGSRRRPVPEKCKEVWSCTKWSECTPNNKLSRVCVDVNACNTTLNKPKEVEECVYKKPKIEEKVNISEEIQVEQRVNETKFVEQKEKEKTYNFFFAILILVLLTIIFSVLLFEIKNLNENRKRQQLKIKEWKNYIIIALKQGFTKEQIKNKLIQLGYDKYFIESILKIE